MLNHYNKRMITEELKEMLTRDRFASLAGITLDEAGEGRAVASVVINESHYNGVGTVQGGLYFTLADFAFAAASNSRGKVAVAVRCDISFIKPASAGKLTATAEEVSCGKTIANYCVRVHDESGSLVAVFNGTAFRKETIHENR